MHTWSRYTPANTAVHIFPCDTKGTDDYSSKLTSCCSPQVKHMLAHVDLRGGYILDSCGSKIDAVYRVLTDEGLHVLTNDMNQG